jgi:hypothetical protein
MGISISFIFREVDDETVFVTDGNWFLTWDVVGSMNYRAVCDLRRVNARLGSAVCGQ